LPAKRSPFGETEPERLNADQPPLLNLQAAPAEFETSWSALLSAQTQLLSAAIELAQQQLTCIRSGDLEQLRVVLSSKQRLADRLSATATELVALAADPTVETLSPTARQRCRHQQAVAISLYEQLFELEHTAQQLLNQRRTQMAQRAQTAGSWIDQASAYASTTPVELRGARLDLSSNA
jgi:LAS superfamily LD-carboxypeptidase LdcB